MVDDHFPADSLLLQVKRRKLAGTKPDFLVDNCLVAGLLYVDSRIYLTIYSDRGYLGGRDCRLEICDDFTRFAGLGNNFFPDNFINYGRAAGRPLFYRLFSYWLLFTLFSRSLGGEGEPQPDNPVIFLQLGCRPGFAFWPLPGLDRQGRLVDLSIVQSGL